MSLGERPESSNRTTRRHDVTELDPPAAHREVCWKIRAVQPLKHAMTKDWPARVCIDSARRARQVWLSPGYSLPKVGGPYARSLSCLWLARPGGKRRRD